ncbi:hypothetical protein EMIT0P228_30145 [Pseudomonas brassicacearum]
MFGVGTVFGAARSGRFFVNVFRDDARYARWSPCGAGRCATGQAPSIYRSVGAEPWTESTVFAIRVGHDRLPCPKSGACFQRVFSRVTS